MAWLRFGTALGLHFGPAVATGGFTRQTALTATNVTALALLKHGASVVVSVTGRTLLHVAHGHYRLNLLSGDVNTLGHLTLLVRASGAVQKALPIWEQHQVVPANVYDSLISGGDRLQADATQWAGAATATGDVALKATLAKTTDITGFTDVTASGVWAAAARTLTSGGNVASSVWGRTQAELASVPTATAAAGARLMFLYMSARNKRITTATGDKVHTSATAVVATAVLSYVSGTTTFTKGKYA